MKKTVCLMSLLLALILLAACGNGAQETPDALEALDYAAEKAEAKDSFLSQLPDGNAVVLLCSAPAAGQMRKTLFFSHDGGENWADGLDLTESIGNYPVGAIFLTPQRGFVLTDYHGVDDYLYATSDGGASWESVGLPLAGSTFSYIEGREIRYENGTLYLSLAGKTETSITHLRFRSDDGGVTWLAY